MFQVSTLDLCKLHTGLQLASKLVSLFHCMARLGSARVFIFNWQKLQLVPGTWHFIWYHLSQGSKRVEPILKAKTLETADRSERIVTCTIRDVLHKPAVLNGQAIINRDCNFFIHSKKKRQAEKPHRLSVDVPLFGCQWRDPVWAGWRNVPVCRIDNDVTTFSRGIAMMGY